MPNLLAYVALFSWPIYILWALKRYPTKNAIFLSLTLAALLIPSDFSVDPPFIPPLDKDSITYISLVVFLVMLGKKFRIFLPGLPTKLMIAYLGATFFSSMLNGDPVFTGLMVLPGISLYDTLTFVMLAFLHLTPFFFGRYYSTGLRDAEGYYKLLVVLALIYSLPMLLEMRISPQLQHMVYGFNASSFLQQIRDGGYRPMVFYGHGLGLAFWFSTCIVGLVTLIRCKVRKIAKFPSVFVLVYLLIVLFLCKTWSAMFYAMLACGFIFLLSPNRQVKYAFIIALFVLLYPVGKISGVLPEKEIVSAIAANNPSRAQSLNFRLENETVLLAHALERPYFGWSGYGRIFVYDDFGKNKTIVDGRWIIELAANGIIGFIFYYAILIIPLYYAKKYIYKIQDPIDKIYFASLAVMLLICILDSIPNTGMRPMHLFLAGALLGQAEYLKKLGYTKKVSMRDSSRGVLQNE
jgi:hypothetical protein